MFDQNHQVTDKGIKPTSITVKVNEKSVSFENHKVTGLKIKQTAIAQGVNIQLDFVLFEVKGQGNLKPVADTEEVTLTKNSEFRAIAPDDNSCY